MEQKAAFPYQIDRAIEHALREMDGIPVRAFGLLYPLWMVEIAAQEDEKRPYALIERFLVRGLYEARLQTVEELVAFFGLSSALVLKILRFLETIQHVKQVEGGRWILTETGIQSFCSGMKRVRQQKSQYLYFDGICSRPLLQEHYTNKLRILTDREAGQLASGSTIGFRFYRLSLPVTWDAQALTDLEHHPDRGRYNLPSTIHSVTAISNTLAYLPMYIIETRRRAVSYYLAYTHVKELRDPFFERLVNETERIRRSFHAMQHETKLAELWTRWLISKDLAYLTPRQTPEGIWRVVLPDSLFRSSTFSFRSIGSFHKERGYFLQLWCHNEAFRRRAIFERAMQLLKKKTLDCTYMEELLQRWSQLLDVQPVKLDELRVWLQKQGDGVKLLQKLLSRREEKQPDAAF
ncbi:hypothetical protein EI42_03441 [Thermosporothrix hazakensis]|jgi:hypothetical protein|uniref:Uncharacterized protein n=1 Tax=Thermosporothrix hazakensis TaxID=644383 RepID=A0A326U4Y0_THEHA|nr:hypothetical protein [Thermosporothrix hazakensis]PZW28063.1 hypothetical protein EI42_03441 [Thermosporothrix hazakensis]GCE51285.1 hypothetical protein KTH_61540 [Thermosporothrix hazakensis]